MWKFEDDLVIQHANVMNKWDLKYCLWNPDTSNAIRLLAMGWYGPEYDFISIMHPKGFPQSMMIDYNNIIGNGSTALYYSPHKKPYYLYAWPSM